MDREEKTSKRKYDIIVFGGSGFTGRFVIMEMYRFSKTYNFTWAVAGRDINKLRTTLDNVWEKFCKEIESRDVENDAHHDSDRSLCYDKPQVDVVSGDVSDVKTIIDMTQATKVLINCVGPYGLYGETVVAQCVSNGTHYVDVTGEPLFMDHMAYKYDEQAQDNRSVVVNALGLECVPSDMGVEFLYKNFKGRLWDVDVYIKFSGDRNNTTGSALLNEGTWKSGLLHMAESKQRRRYRSLLDESKPGLSECRPNLDISKILHRRCLSTRPVDGDAKKAGNWCIMFPEPDQSTVARSIHHARKVDGLPYDFHVRNYVVVGGLFTCVLMLFIYMVMCIAVPFEPVRKLLIKYPRVFSMGIVSESGPDEQSMATSLASLLLIGRGCTRLATESDDQNDQLTAKRETIVKVVVPNPGYGFTSKSVVLAAVTILKDYEHIPNGGILTPASAFRHTQFLDRLIEHGAATFEVVSDVIVDKGQL